MKHKLIHMLIGGILLISLLLAVSGCAAEPAVSADPITTEETRSYTEPQTQSDPAETTAPVTKPEETKQTEAETSAAETTSEAETSAAETTPEPETSAPETTAPAETSADPAASADIIVTDPRSRVYATTYNWGENADEKYTCILILTPPESETSERNEAGLVWEGWTYEFRNPGPYIENLCEILPFPWSGRLWKNETMGPFWFLGSEDGPEQPEYEGPCIFWESEDRFRFSGGPAFSYYLFFTPAE